MLTTILAVLVLLSPRATVTDPLAHQALAALTVAVVATPTERRDLYRLAGIESRWTPTAASREGAFGLWQQIPRWSRIPTSRAYLTTRPVHAALVALTTYRAMRRVCGGAWLRCYQRGPSKVRDDGRRW